MNRVDNFLSRQQQRLGTYICIALVLLCAIAILYSRRPTEFQNPQFWAEDGKVWYANAYNLGPLKSALLAQDGYFQTFSRIAAGSSILFDMSHAPRIFMLAAIGIQLLPVLLIVSGRLNNLIPSPSVRLLLIFLYLALPNTAEVFGNLTNAQWYLALTSVMLLIASDPPNRFWKIFDLTSVALSGLSGPFSIFLLPISFLLWWKTKNTWTLKLFWVIAATALLQLYAIVFLFHGSRWHILQEFEPNLIPAILNRQVFLGLILGSKGFVWLQNNFAYSWAIFNLSTVLGIFLTGYAFVKSSFQLKLFIAFSGLIFFAGLMSPSLTDPKTPAWETLYNSASGNRYWLIPMCAFLAVLVWGVKKNNLPGVRFFSAALLASMIFGISLDWRYWDLPDLDFPADVRNFRHAQPGTKYIFPLNPPGWTKEPWMELIKH